jgi:mannitol/fructose-specific phosphotransferase system IIA component (Ntr-type)
MLARISRLLKDSVFRESLMNAANGQDLYAIFQQEDSDF